MIVINNTSSMAKYYNEEYKTYVFNDDVIFNCDITANANLKILGSLQAMNINARNIFSFNLNTWDINALYVFSFNDINSNDIFAKEIRAENIKAENIYVDLITYKTCVVRETFEYKFKQCISNKRKQKFDSIWLYKQAENDSRW